MPNKFEIYNPFTEELVKINPVGRTARRIYRYYIEHENISPEFILPPTLTYKNGRIIKKKPAIDYKNIRRLTYAQVDSVDDDTQINFVKNAFAKYAGQTIQIAKKYTKQIGLEAGTIDEAEVIDIPPLKKGFASWWRKWSVWLWVDSETWIFSDEYNEWDDKTLQAQLIFMALDKVGVSDYQQYFLDGVAHCFFQPIKDWAEDTLENAKSKSAQKRYKTFIKKVDKYLVEYVKGVPDTDISDICNRLQIGIEIDMPSTIFGDTKYIECVSQKKPLKKFRFINTRLNHIEINDVKTKDNYEEVSQDELEKIYDEARDKDEFVMWKGSQAGLLQVNTLNNVYKLTTEEGYCKECMEFENANNLRNYKIEHFQNKALSYFLLEHMNGNQNLLLADYEFEGNNSLFYEGVYDMYDEDIEKELAGFQKYIDEHELLLTSQPSHEHYWINNRIKYKKEEVKALEASKQFKKRVETMEHIDLKKAYAQGDKCFAYEGYLGKITDFRKTDKIEGLGIYMINNIQYNGDPRLMDIIKRMKILYNENAYPSPELKYYKSIGIDFDIVMGCYGTRLDIDFSWRRVNAKKEAEVWTEEDELDYEDMSSNLGMYQKDEDTGTSYYVKWYGCCMKLTTKDRYSFSCKDIEFAKLCTSYDEADMPDIRYNEYREEGVLEYQKKKAYHSAHIAAFIHSYSRLSIVEQLTRFKNIDNVLAVQVDGIYYDKGAEVDINTKIFSKKPGNKNLQHITSECYVEKTDYQLVDFEAGGYFENCGGKPIAMGRKNNKVEVHSGAGGTGKTYHNITDNGLIMPLFVAPSWKLARNKKKEFGIDSSVFFYLLDDDPDKYTPILRYYNTLIIDEISMLSNECKKKIMKRFKTHKIIFCGDIGYQLPPIEGKPFKIGKLPEINHNHNYRCKCDKLAKILLRIRKAIEEYGDAKITNLHTITGLKVHDKETIDYKVEDLIIAKTHKSKDIYTEKYKDIEKYAVLENTRDYSNGDIIEGPKPAKVRAELRHAFTIHSIQGETAQNKLFIDMNKLTNLRMLYTALSRAQYLNQIILIK